MFKEIIKELNASIVKKDNNNVFPVFEAKGYEGIEISENNFRDINENNDYNNKIIFIDGGNNTILSSFNFNLQFIRVVAVVNENNKRKKIEKNEFYSLTTTKYRDKKVYYNTRFFPIKEKLFDNELEFDSMSEELKEGNFRISVGKIANLTRRLAEIKFAAEKIDGLNEGDIIVLDGSLMATTEIEKEFLDELYSLAEQKNIIISSLTKTSRIFTTTGASIIDILNSFNRLKWSYYPAFNINNESHRAELYFVKLHKRAEYVFRFEIYNKQKDYSEKIISLLSSNSKDAAFPGYPYGLVTADRFARVANEEAEYFRTRFMAEAGKDFKLIEKSMKSVDMHDRLSGI
ncbi:DNA double-strand break repair nuclease NurA [Candidatus Woesearchaeota archaeon]|nr:DNA double-strand break repair nuclease NurA [Candidatus Woesearchaeota archaeon]